MTHARRIIDLSHPLGPDTPAFPGDPAPEIRIFDSTDRPSTAGERHLNSSYLGTSLHCGTHMDAPFHFFADGRTIDCVPAERTVGPALLIDLPWERVGLSIGPEHLEPHRSQFNAIRRVVLNTAWHHRWGQPNYFTHHPVITGPAAELLVELGVELVGVDTPSVDRPPFEAHLALLGNDVLILENLTNLDKIGRPTFELFAAPLKVVGRDGSPVRALAFV